MYLTCIKGHKEGNLQKSYAINIKLVIFSRVSYKQHE